MEDNGTIIDLNKVTRSEFNEFRVRLMSTDIQEKEQANAELISKVVVKWPYDMEVSVENYLNLGLSDSKAIEDKVTQAINNLTKKN